MAALTGASGFKGFELKFAGPPRGPGGLTMLFQAQHKINVQLTAGLSVKVAVTFFNV